MRFTSLVTPNPAAVFSPLTFARGIDLKTYTPLEPGTVFENPIKRLLAVFSFDGMATGVQWSVLWLRDGELVYYETAPWQDTTGGYGSVELAAPQGGWLPGNYELQIFVGEEWKSVGRFVVEGIPPTVTPTRVPSATPRPTQTRVPTSTRIPTYTPRSSDTPWPSQTPTP